MQPWHGYLWRNPWWQHRSRPRHGRAAFPGTNHDKPWQTLHNLLYISVHPAPRSPKISQGTVETVIMSSTWLEQRRNVSSPTRATFANAQSPMIPTISGHRSGHIFSQTSIQDYTRRYKKCLFERWKWSGWIWLNSRTMSWTFDFDFVRRSNTDFRHMQEVRSMCKEHQGTSRSSRDFRSFRISSRGNRAGSLVVSQCIIPAGWGTAAPSAKRPTSANLGLTAVAMTSPLSQNRHSMTQLQLNHVKSNCDNLSAVKSVFLWQCHHARKDSVCGRLVPVYIL